MQLGAVLVPRDACSPPIENGNLLRMPPADVLHGRLPWNRRCAFMGSIYSNWMTLPAELLSCCLFSPNSTQINSESLSKATGIPDLSVAAAINP